MSNSRNEKKVAFLFTKKPHSKMIDLKTCENLVEIKEPLVSDIPNLFFGYSIVGVGGGWNSFPSNIEKNLNFVASERVQI